jgi:hypothetical protein
MVEALMLSTKTDIIKAEKPGKYIWNFRPAEFAAEAIKLYPEIHTGYERSGNFKEECQNAFDG